jgi:hypothetical protein
MTVPRWQLISGITLLACSGALFGQETGYSDVDCPYLGPQRARFYTDATRRQAGIPESRHLSATTQRVSEALGFLPGGSRTYNFDQKHAAGSIDSYIYADFQANGITPAPRTTDWEFIRRVTLDLTGRIPTPERVLSFVADTTPDKRSKLIDELLAKPEYVDKWTMFFGDLYKNTVTLASTGTVRYADGRNAFYNWIKDSVANNKPYNQMATELISASGDNSYTDGRLNFMVGSRVVMGPAQDIMDQMASDTFGVFLGMSHVNCVLCHNGRGHLDNTSLWAVNTTRYQAWQLSSYFSRTSLAQIRVDPTVNNSPYYWSVLNNQKGYTADYTLNTLTGNRPARQPATGCKSGQPCNYVAPQYVLNGDAPKPGEDYRAALARNITGDFQFARASVNRLWAYFFGRGIVDPPDVFDPMRLDPDNPPPDPWTLQPSNARLLKGLAQHFVDSGYNVKAMIREIVNSDTYQLSTAYPGQWNEAWEPYFARKFARRLWGEEVLDAVQQATGVVPTYTLTGSTDVSPMHVSWAMQFPDVVNIEPNTNGFLDTFFRGNRDDQPRKSDGSILQALNLMNSSVVETKLATTGALIMTVITLPNSEVVNKLYITILSRYPTKQEAATALAALPTATGATRNSAIQDLAWSLFNKVDFVFNY